MSINTRLTTMLLNLLPFLKQRPPDRATIRCDLVAGITVGLVLIPQALAYAQLAGMPPETGLYAAFLPGLVGALFGSSALLAVGPVALTSLLTYAALQPLATPASAEWVSLAIWLAIYSGLIQFLLGALRLGFISNLVSNAVIKGFITAAAIIIAVSQIPSLVGQDRALGESWQSLLSSDSQALWQMLLAAAFGLGAIAALLLCKRILPRLPGVMAVCLAGIVLSQTLGFAANGGAVVGQIEAGLPVFAWPVSLRLDMHLALLLPALVIALISFTEAMSSCRTVARATHEPWNTNQELIGQGLAKLSSAFSGGFPVSGSFSRTALNAYVGARTRCSTLVASLMVLACLIGFTDVLYHLPRAVLAAIIIVPVWRLVDIRGLMTLLRNNPKDGVIAVATLITTLVSVPNLYWGLIVGLSLSIVMFLHRHAAPRIIEISLHETGALRDRHLYNLPPLVEDTLAVRMDASLTYLTAPVLESYISRRLESNRKIKKVLICASALNQIDSTGVDTLRSLFQLLRGQDVELFISNPKLPVREALARSGLLTELGAEHIFATDQQAIAYLCDQNVRQLHANT